MAIQISIVTFPYPSKKYLLLLYYKLITGAQMGVFSCSVESESIQHNDGPRSSDVLLCWNDFVFPPFQSKLASKLARLSIRSIIRTVHHGMSLRRPLSTVSFYPSLSLTFLSICLNRKRSLANTPFHCHSPSCQFV